MEGGSLFTSGFAGAHFNWWIGQIADDSTWRDNTAAGKHESGSQIPGWGRRYKVRIIGYHDQQEETIPSDQLPWAQVMYPITAGGGQGSSSQTPNLRQGNFVFGFFLDGQDQQVPVIMGVLGNNAQTSLQTTTGTTKSNFGPTSGFAKSATGETDPNRKVPDSDLVVNKPKTKAQKDDTDPPPPGVKLNKYGLRPDKPLTSQQLKDAQAARAEAEARGLTGQEREDFVMKAVADGIAARKAAAESPASPSQPGATKESADAVHQQSVADVKKNDRQTRKIPLADPYNTINSSLKNIQIILDNLTKDINKILETAQSYIDAASNILDDISSLISGAACIITKYMKPIFDKIFEYILKTVHKAIAPTTNIMFPNQRNLMSDLKEQITQILTCLWEKLIAGLCDLLNSLLRKGLGLDKNGALLEALDTTNVTPENKVPKVPMCYVETLTGDVLSSSKEEITNSVDDIIQNVGEFLEEISSQIDAVQDGLSSLSGAIPSIDGLIGNISSALSFANLQFSVFGCDLVPKVSVSDFYTFATGSNSQEESETPNVSEVSETAASSTVTTEPVQTKQFSTPPRDSGDIDYKSKTSSEQTRDSRTRNINARGGYDPRYDR